MCNTYDTSWQHLEILTWKAHASYTSYINPFKKLTEELSKKILDLPFPLSLETIKNQSQFIGRFIITKCCV